MIYKERYEIQKVKSPEDVKKSFYVRHLIPKDGGTYLAIGEIRYFETLEEAQAYQEAQEARIKAKEGAKA